MCVVSGLTLNLLLNISITGFFDFVFLARYSVIPLNVPLKKVCFEIGPFIIPDIFFFYNFYSFIKRLCNK